jgi:predicted RNase H-like nuclease (RuvC/YqgF family)
MATLAKAVSKPVAMSEHAVAREAMDAIEQIERQAREKKLAQVAKLEEARKAIQQRMAEFQHQIEQLETAMETIAGALEKPRQRRDLSEVRERVYVWLQSHKGEAFKAGQIIEQFPELDGVALSTFLKPMTDSGKVSTDTSEGVRRTRYSVR